MKKTGLKVLSAILLVTLVLGFIPVSAYAATPNALVIGSNYSLDNGETLNDDLVIFGGNVILMSGSTVNGSVILFGGSLDAAGTVNGDIVVFGGTVNLASTFVMHGDMITAGTHVNRDPAAQIFGETFSPESNPSIILPGGLRWTDFTYNFNPFLHVGGFFIGLFLWALVAMVVAMFIPVYLARTSQTVLSQPLISGGMGILTIIVGPIVIIFLAITICFIPFAFLGALLLIIAWAFGLIAIGLEVGKRISAMFKQEWHPAITAGLGTLVIMIVLDGLNTFVPCVGWIPKFIIGLIGLGAVLLTQFGRKAYNPNPSLPAENPEGSLPA